METKKRKHDIELEKNDSTLGMSSSPTTLMSLRSGTVSIVEAVAVNLPDVFAAEIVPKLDWISTLNLAQVSKSYRDAVWSVPGVSSIDEKLHVAKMEHGPVRLCVEQLTLCAGRQGHMNLPAVRAFVESGRLDSERGVNLRSLKYGIEYHWLACRCLQRGHEAVVKVLIDAGADVNIRSHGGTPLFLAALFGLHASCSPAHKGGRERTPVGQKWLNPPRHGKKQRTLRLREGAHRRWRVKVGP